MGGKDEGVQLSRNVSEKDITLAVATLIKRNLEDSKNLVVRFTRMGDTDVPLADRVGAAIKANADLFISLHVNAGFEKESAGYELYFPGFKGQEGSKGPRRASPPRSSGTWSGRITSTKACDSPRSSSASSTWYSPGWTGACATPRL